MKYNRIPRFSSILLLTLFASFTLVGKLSAQPFTFSAKNTDLTRLSYGSIEVADVDRDGDFDVLYAGNSRALRPFSAVSAVAINQALDLEGSGLVSFDATRLSSETWLGSASWADIDLDGDLDFALSGTASPLGPYPSVSLLYMNDGSGNFSPLDVGLMGVHASGTDWIDYDNDGDPDLTLSGRLSDGTHAVILYRNDGGDSFVEVDTPFAQLAFGDVAWADYDNDGDHDVLITGTSKDGQFRSFLYQNSGSGTFALSSVQLAEMAFSSAAWGDYDSDGDLDLVLSGAELGIQEAFVGRTILYDNVNGNFVPRSDGFLGVFSGDQAWADYDLDGDLDLYIMGRTSMLANHVAFIYQNNDGDFKVVTGLSGTSTGNSEWVDIDGDNDIDVLLSGINLAAGPSTKLYRNDSRLVNRPPSAPTGLSSSVGPGEATMSWSPGDDVHTAPLALTYNVRVGTTPGAGDVMSAMASSQSGRRWTTGLGNVGQNVAWTLKGLPVGLYYWSVQSVDNSFIGSAFAAETQFTVSTGGKISTASEEGSNLPVDTALNPVYPNPFSGSTTLSFDLPKSSPVSLTIYDILGKRIKILVDGVYSAGRHLISWDGLTESGTPIGSGVYFAKMETDQQSRSQRLVVVR